MTRNVTGGGETLKIAGYTSKRAFLYGNMQPKTYVYVRRILSGLFLSIAVIAKGKLCSIPPLKAIQMEANIKDTIVRISIGYFQPEQADLTANLLNRY